MSPRVLLGWEIGEHRGHVLRMRDIAVRLRAEGAEVAWAAVRLDQLEGIARPGEPIWQSPLWPGFHLDVVLAHRPGIHRSHADLLADLGLRLPGAFGHVLAAWDSILAAARPHAVFADYAPALIAACRGRVPTVAAGIGFTLPPGHLGRFPSYGLDEEEPGGPDREPDLLAEANRGLARVGRPTLDRLPALFAADSPVVASFKELDPYASDRLVPAAAPFVLNWSPPAPRAGSEVIVYWSERHLGLEPFFAALDRLGALVRIVAPGVTPEHRARYASHGNIAFLGEPLHFSEIARSARIVVSNGNTGFVSAAMLAGLPQVILPYDVQKILVGRAVDGLGVGISTPLEGCDWEAWPGRVRALLDDGGARVRAVALARRLIPRMHRDPADLCADALLRFARGETQAPPAAPEERGSRLGSDERLGMRTPGGSLTPHAEALAGSASLAARAPAPGEPAAP